MAIDVVADRESRRRAWERHTEWPLTAVAGAFLVAYAWPIIEPGISQVWHTLCNVFTWLAWGAFVADYSIRLTLSARRRRFVRTNLIDLVIIVAPLLRRFACSDLCRC